MKRGILRVIGINLMCVSLLFLSAFCDFSPKKSFSYNIKGETGENVNTEPANNEEKNENSSPEKVQEEEKENESKTESSEKTTTQVSASAIKGNIIDLAYMVYNECIQFGRRQMQVYILKKRKSEHYFVKIAKKYV